MSQEDERIARKLLDLTSRGDRVQIRNGMTYLDGFALGNGTVEISRQVVRDRRMRDDIDLTGFLETFVIRIESPEVNSVYALDPHQFWGIKIKDIQVFGGDLEFISRKSGEGDSILTNGGIIPKEGGLLARVVAATNQESIVCSILLEHKFDHKLGWEAIPFNSNETESGSYTIVAALPYPATLLALDGVPSEFSYSLNPAINAEISGPVVATFTRVQEGESSFLGSLLIKRQGQERRILERLSFKFTATGEVETEYLIDPYQHKSVKIEGVEGLSVPVGSIQILIKKDGAPDVALDLGEPISLIAPKGSQIVARLNGVAADELVSGRILMRRLG